MNRKPYTKPTMTTPARDGNAARVFAEWYAVGHIDELLRDLLRRRLDTGYPSVPAIVSAARRVVDYVVYLPSLFKNGQRPIGVITAPANLENRHES